VEACIIAAVGKEPDPVDVLVEVVLVDVEVVLVEVVVTGDPVLVRYLMPLVPQEPVSGALIGTNVPSMTLPIRWK